MDVDLFLQTIAPSEIRLPTSVSQPLPGRAPETVDALFHLPLLALTIMVIARHTPFQTTVLGRGVTLLLVEHFSALSHSPHGLETSLTLRRRCADALAFLEAAGLVSVSQDRLRTVTLTQAGKAHLDDSGRDASDLGLFVRKLRANHDRVIRRMGNER